jgi:hypothetical protein
MTLVHLAKLAESLIVIQLAAVFTFISIVLVVMIIVTVCIWLWDRFF